MEKKDIVILGHSFMRRLGMFCQQDRIRLNLGLSTEKYKVSAVVVPDGRAAGRRLINSLRNPVVRSAEVIFVHLGEIDVASSLSAETVAQELYSSVSGHWRHSTR
jgi:hypothetical protein